MDEQQAIVFLQEHGVRPTANRIVIAKALAAENRPLSMRELESQILTIDKSNIFRTLILFREKHLVHTREDGSDTVRCELCHRHLGTEDEDAQVHFYCERCKRTFCLTDISTPLVELPMGFTLHSVNYMMKGLCPKCRNKR